MGDEIDHTCTDYPVCPHCGSVYEDTCDMGNDGDIECDDCGGWFTYSADYSVTYCTRKLENGAISTKLKRGVKVLYHPVTDEAGEERICKGRPWHLYDGEQVVGFEGYAGGHAVSNISKIIDSETP